MKRKRNKKMCMVRKEAPKPATYVKRKEVLNCFARQRHKLIHYAIHRRGC